MPKRNNPQVRSLTCKRCGTTKLEETARKSWHCVSPGVLGSTDVYWLCPYCYAVTYRQRGSKDKGTV